MPEEFRVKSDQFRIFVVDDNQLIASTIADILRLNGFEAAWFTRSRDALVAAKSDCPDLVLCEIGIPDFSGIELAIKLKELHLDCDILFLTRHHRYIDLLDQAEDMGHHFQVLEKPIAPRTLIAEIQYRNWRTS
jgi:DNA-binding response OmpR family regulator